jgi:hypothetical protein
VALAVMLVEAELAAQTERLAMVAVAVVTVAIVEAPVVVMAAQAASSLLAISGCKDVSFCKS